MVTQRNFAKLTCLTAALICLSAAPCLAHPLPKVATPEADAASGLFITICAATLIGMAAYRLVHALVAQYEKHKSAYFDTRAVNALAMACTMVVVLTVWHLGSPSASQATSVSAYEDRPQHGGQLQSVGSNHIELAVSKSGAVSLYLMGIADTVPYPIAQKSVTAKITPQGGFAMAVKLTREPQPGDPTGTASAFDGELPAAVTGRSLSVSFTLPLADQNHNVQFKIARPGVAGIASSPTDSDSPTRVVATKPTTSEQKLFLTPGGAYTKADIAANGNTTPEIKYAGLMANHHLNPKKGTYTCPITKTQANSKFAWTVGGKRYLFCCPPCIAEFVQQAKTKPNSINDPIAYIQQ